MSILDKLFGSHARVKLIKLFYLNSSTIFTTADAAKRSQTSPAVTRREIRVLADIGLIKRASGVVEIKPEEGKKSTKKKISGYILNKPFPLLGELRDLMLTVPSVSRQELITRLRKVGRVKLIVLSGIFLKQSDSRVDLLLVGDSLRKNQLERNLKVIESEVGKEIEYAILDIADFKYRLGMNDRFIRDVFDYPHEIIMDKIGVVR